MGRWSALLISKALLNNILGFGQLTLNLAEAQYLY